VVQSDGNSVFNEQGRLKQIRFRPPLAQANPSILLFIKGQQYVAKAEGRYGVFTP
jgi:hypothetical protein